jgi:hypothetical protein
MTTTVQTTVTVDGVTKTFTATAETTGRPSNAARALLFSVRDDAATWTYELDKAERAVTR